MKTVVSNSLEQTREIARDWLAEISKNGNTDGATVVGLFGHLGSGKTAFVQAVATQLGISDQITSPTFVIMKLYDTKNDVFPRLIHMDAYRLEQGRELEALDFERIITDSHNLVMIEWADNVKEILPENTVKICFEATDGNSRKIEFGQVTETK